MRKVRGKIQSANIEGHFVGQYYGEKICKVSEMQKMGLGEFAAQEQRNITSGCRRVI
jgi:hypothetical protein